MREKEIRVRKTEGKREKNQKSEYDRRMETEK